MAIGAAIGGSLIGGISQSRAASKAASAQKSAANQQIALDREIYADQTERFAPYLQSGNNANNALQFEMGLGERPEGYGGFQASPGYDFAMSQGQRAIDGSAASQGGLFSGATLKAQQQFGTGLAQQDYGNWMNRLGSMASNGQNAAGMQSAAAQNMGVSSGNALASYGNAASAGYIGQGNAITSGIGNALGTYGYLQNMNSSTSPSSLAPQTSLRPQARPFP